MSGFIAITSDDWCSFLQKNGSDCAVFWRKKTSFKALQNGEPFFFLNRKRKGGMRFGVGYGIFNNWELLDSKDAWRKYGTQLGFPTETDFMQGVTDMYGRYDVELGCICLINMRFYEHGIAPEQCGVDFSPYIVSGKTISDNECRNLLNALERSK